MEHVGGECESKMGAGAADVGGRHRCRVEIFTLIDIYLLSIALDHVKQLGAHIRQKTNLCRR